MKKKFAQNKIDLYIRKNKTLLKYNYLQYII